MTAGDIGNRKGGFFHDAFLLAYEYCTAVADNGALKAPKRAALAPSFCKSHAAAL
jgi:hypothetical protein